MTLLPAPWDDPVFTRQQAEVLLAQPHHHLFTIQHSSTPTLQYSGTPALQHSHLLARLVPQTPADVLTLYTPPEFRRQGHARTLMQQLVTAARDAACPAITLEVRAANTAARGLYESLGFTPQAIRRVYYQNPCDDAVVYSLDLG